MTANTSEDSPFILEEGTEVSAKFKGAFCEAKIKKVDRIVKCKITLKNSNESQTVNDTQIFSSTGQKVQINDLKQGQIVFVNKSTDNSNNNSPSRNLQQATLNRVIDQSVYTVVFNDGDEKCLKRSFIRFKGEKHYLDSETLNNAPLNNPEHFLYPIKSQTKQSPNSSVNEKKTSDNESETESISNTTCTSLSIKNKKEQDREEDEEDDDSSSTSSSDDYPPEEKDLFVAQLYKFMDDRGTPMNKVPSINKIDIDLHKFFIIVKKYGGYNKINKQRNWSDVYKRIGLPNPSSANVINLKCSYKRYLHPYEELHRKLGGSMLVSASSSKRSISCESKRLFNARYLTPTQKQKAPKVQKKVETPEPIVAQETQQEDVQNESLQEKEFTIESIANSIQDESNQQTQEELTLFGMVRNLNENFKKAKKEKEKEVKTLKRQSNSKTKIRRTSVDKASEQSKKSKSDDEEETEDAEEEEEEEEHEEEEEEEEEPKPKKKLKKLVDVSEESNSTSSRISKRKISTSKPNDDESETEKKTSDLNVKQLPSHDGDGKKIYRSCDIELNKIVEVKYGSGKTTYHAKIVQVKEESQTMLVHYLGWNNRYDEWIKINQIIKIFSDDYGAYKRRKPTKQSDETNSNQTSKPKTEPKIPKTGKRSSLSSTSSSSSAEAKKEPIEPKKEIKCEKKPVGKMRSSDSSSSISSSSDLPNSTSSKVKKNSSNDSNVFVDKEQKSIELELEKIKNIQPETLLSIKEEIMDFEQTVTVPEEPKETESEKQQFIESITNEIVEKCLSEIQDKPPEYIPKTISKKDELIPVFTSEMTVSESNKFVVKPNDEKPPKSPDQVESKEIEDPEQIEEKEEEKPKPVLNESNSLNTINQTIVITETKTQKEKENVTVTKQQSVTVAVDMPKFPYHLIGCKLVGKQKIRFIEEQMRLCREEYAKLKNEMAAIDRKKKKLKRNLLEKSASNSNANQIEGDKLEAKK